MDALLDWRVNDALGRVAIELTCSVDDVQPAFAALTERLWEVRPEGLTHGRALAPLREEFGEHGGEVLAALRKAGLLTTVGAVRLAEPLVADRLFAKRSREHLRAGEDDYLQGLRPETDAGLVVALLRGIATDPVRVAEKLLDRDWAWSSTVAGGLAQCRPDDWRILALVSTLATSNGDQASSDDTYRALGQLAARAGRAWKWVAEMFLGDLAKKWRRGAHALARATEYVPGRVETAVRARLARIPAVEETFSEREKRIRWLTNDALDPLRGINHSSAAQAGERILRRYSHLGGRDGDRNRDWHFVDDIDYARGRIALYGGEGRLATLLQKLAAESNVTRYRAAHALRTVVIERPEVVCDALLERPGEERDWVVLGRLLLASYHLIEPYPDQLLAGLQRSIAFNFREPLATTGQVLVLLGNLAGKRPAEVANLFPPRLEAHEAWTRAFLSEIFAYAWWRCGEHVADARA